MPRVTTLLVVGAALFAGCRGAPTEVHLVERQEINESTPVAAGDMLNSIFGIRPTASPTSIPQVQSMLSGIYGQKPTNSFSPKNIGRLIENGFSPGNLEKVMTTYTQGPNSAKNVNLKRPSRSMYPKKKSTDATYSVSEAALRAAIHIPSTFQYGAVPPIVLVPGTGSTGYLTYSANFIKQFTGSSFADPVWLNIPDFLLDDAQVNAEYVAYAINYVSGISGGGNLSVMAWSQGNLDTQWALKYWPSTRSIVSDFISISPDFDGTIEAPLLCTIITGGCPPSVKQQVYDSKFVDTLRKEGGDSAYVPTTTIYSSTDEVVQPQSGLVASAIIRDKRRVGVSNFELQVVCAGGLAGVYATHEGMLYNSLAYALAVDALTHDGPGEVSRINKLAVCNELASPGLDLVDVIATEGNIIIAVIVILLYEPKVLLEPWIKAYALW